MRLESHAAQSAQCMRLKPMPVPHLVGFDRPCVHIKLAQRQTQSHPVSWPPAGTTPDFRLPGITHENPNTTGESFRVLPPRRPGAKSTELQVSAHAMPMSMNQTASRVRPSSLQARPRGCVLVNLSMITDTRLDEKRFVRCSSGSPSTLFTMTCYRQLRICIFTTSLATSLASSCRSASPGVFFSQRLPARTRLAPPLLRPTPPSRLVSRKIAVWEGVGRGSRLLPLPAMHAHSRLAVPAFAWIRLPWSRSNLVIGHGAGVCA